MGDLQHYIDQLEAAQPDIVRLARLVACAVRVDPPLLRAIRRAFLPGSDAGVEADLWFSSLVQYRSPDGFVFFAAAAEALREGLAARKPALYEEAWTVLERMHRHLQPALRLEEEVAYLSLSRRPDARTRTQTLIRSAVAALVGGDRRGLAHWAARALPRFPSKLLAPEETAMLTVGARLRLEGQLDAVQVLPEEADPEWMAWVVPSDLDQARLGLRLFPGVLEINTLVDGEDSERDGAVVEIPRTTPLVLEVATKEGGVEGEDYEYDVAVIYSSGNNEQAKILMDRFQNATMRVWIEVVGDSISEALQRGIERSQTIVFMISPEALALKEPLIALEQAAVSGKKIIPVQLREVDRAVIPAFLLSPQWLDFERVMDDERVFQRLVEAIRPAAFQRVALQPGAVRRVAVGVGALTVRTLLGDVYELEPDLRKAVFVVLPSDEGRKDYYDVVRDVVEETGHRIVRGTPRRAVSPETREAIGQADLVLAELSEAAPDVYFNLGYAEGSGKPLFLTSRSRSVLPLDIRDLRVLSWKSTSDLRNKLAKDLRRILDEDPLRSRFDLGEQPSRSLKVFVAGGFDPKEPSAEAIVDLARALGREIMRRGHTLLGAAQTELDRVVAEAAFDFFSMQKSPEAAQERRLISYVTPGQKPVHNYGTILVSQVEQWDAVGSTSRIPEVIEEADVVILVGGYQGTQVAANWARIAGKPLLPFASLGGAAQDAYKVEIERYDGDSASGISRLDYGEALQSAGPGEEKARAALLLAEKIALSSSVYVLLSFKEELAEDVYEVIKRICGEYGYEVWRPDDLSQTGSIGPQVLAQIGQSAFVIAEVSQPDPNLYYELGLAQALGKQTILVAREGTDLPFDIIDTPVIFWKDRMQTLIEDLRRQIEAIAPGRSRAGGSDDYVAV